MDKTFPLQVYTPEKTFFIGDIYSVTVESLNGRLSVLAGHIPMVCSLSLGMLELRTAEGKRVAFHSAGFMDVGADQVLIFAQACEWPEEIDLERAEAAVARAKGRLLNPIFAGDTGWIEVALQRAQARLKVRDYAAGNLADIHKLTVGRANIRPGRESAE